MSEKLADQIILSLDKKVDHLSDNLSEIQVSLAVVCAALERYKDMPERQQECSGFISSVRRTAFWACGLIGTMALSACGYVATHYVVMAEKVTKLNELLK